MRSLGILLAALLGLTVVAAPPGQAADPLTGRIVDAVDGGGVGGITVRLRRVTEAGPGAVVATDTTSADGTFALDAGATPDDEYYVQALPGAIQGGYVGAAPKFVTPQEGDAVTWGPHDALGKIGANPSYIRGVLVDAATGRPVRGVRVSGGEQGEPAVDTDVTDRRGRFVVQGITCEDSCFLRFRGRPRGYENGFRSCDAGVVPTWGEACASEIGRIGKVRIDHL